MIKGAALELRDIELRQTSEACPEQYDAMVCNHIVGYIRLRHGVLRIDMPECGDTMVAVIRLGDEMGMFPTDDRTFYLEMCRRIILANMIDDWYHAE